MKKRNQLIIVISQFIIAFFIIFYTLISLIDSFRFFTTNYLINLRALLYLVQLLCFSYISLQIYQMNEPRRQIFSVSLLLALLNLSANFLIIVPTMFNTFNIDLLPPILLGKINNFTLINALLLLILCGVNQNDTNVKNINYEISITILLSLFLSYIIPINSPTTENNLIIFEQKPIFSYLYIFFIVLAVLSYIPSYLQDKSSHNRYKTIAFILFVVSIGVLNYSLTLNPILGLIFIGTLIFSSIFLIINLKSYTI